MPFAATGQISPEPDLYQEALQLIEKGDTSGAIDRYNRLLKELPNHAGAWIDLALLYCELGEVTHAHQIFDQVEQQFQPPPAILELIRHYRRQGCVSARAPSGRWSLSVSAGHTDNVNHGLSNPVIDLTLPLGLTSIRVGGAFLPRSSAIATVGASYVQGIKALPGALWFIGGTEKKFPSVQEFNQRSLLTGITQQRTVNGWLQEYELVATHLSMNERSHQAGILAQGALWLPATSERAPRFGVEVAASRWRYPHDPLYDSTVFEGRINARWVPNSRMMLRGAIGPVADLASRQRPGLDRRGYLFHLHGQWAISDQLRIDAGFRQRRLQDEAAYSPLFGTRKHHSTQRQFLVGLQSRKDMASPSTWRLEWERSESRDNIPLFPYTSQTLAISWQYQWDVF